MTVYRRGRKAATQPMAARSEYVAPKLGWRGTVETLIWAAILGHIIHWAVDALYYLTTQVRYAVQAPYGQVFTVWYLKDAWDRGSVHIANLLGLHDTILNNRGQAAPLWFITWRHDIRYVIIGVLTGVAVTFLVSKLPKRRTEYTWYRLAATPGLALLFAVPGVLAGGLAIWRITALQTGGITPPASWGALGNEIAQWSGSGKLALVVLGLLGSQFFARHASGGPADEAQWLYAGRKANRILRQRTGALAAVGNLRDSLVIGPPGYRHRVAYLVSNNIVSKSRGTGITVVLWLFMVVTLLLAGYGAWLTLAGPAANA